ncbi:MAG: aminomethyltransferase family protein [Vicinamibacterales bacterium]
MPIGSAFHARTLPLASSLSFRDWAGYYAASAYETHHEHEYNAIRNGCALIDISPLFKYHLHGPDVLRLVDRVITRDASKLAVGQVYYTPWCDDDGKVIDDGTVARLAEDRIRWTAADPNLRWLLEHARGLRVSVEDVTDRVAALALQGPTSDLLLGAVSDIDVAGLKYFRAAAGTIAGVPVEVTRTGYTGDLGYEVWMPWDRALEVWDAVVEAGRAHVLRPAGMLALDVARVEAGLLLTDVDFHSVRKASIDQQAYSPFELGLGRLVALDKASPFVGRTALARERAEGHRRQIVGLEVRWTEVEAIYQSVGLPPAVPAAASRVAVPVYLGRQQVGKATSTAWSPTMKKLIALATVDRPHFADGTELQMEITVEATRYTATATVVPTPFLKLARRSGPARGQA